MTQSEQTWRIIFIARCKWLKMDKYSTILFPDNILSLSLSLSNLKAAYRIYDIFSRSLRDRDNVSTKRWEGDREEEKEKVTDNRGSEFPRSCRKNYVITRDLWWRLMEPGIGSPKQRRNRATRHDHVHVLSSRERLSLSLSLFLWLHKM